MRKRLDGLSALKALACMGVFISHVSHELFDGAGALAVSIFLIVLGFTMFYNYYGEGRIVNTSLMGGIAFAHKKISKLYLLFFLTTCVMAVFLFMGDEKVSIPYSVFLLLVNAVFLQEWMPIKIGSINGVAWFLCTIVLAYSLFPLILQFMERDYSKRKAVVSLIGLLILQFVIGLAGKYIPSPEYISSGWWRADFTNWFVYRFPAARLIDFLVGCNLGYLYLNRDTNKTYKPQTYTIYEILAGGGVILSIIVYHLVSYNVERLNMSVRPDKWWIYTILFTVLSSITVYLFALNKGQISKIMCNDVMLYLSRISPYMFLIHYVVIQYLSGILKIILSNQSTYEQIIPWVSLVIGLPLSVLCSHIWMKWTDCMRKRKRSD